MEQNCDSLHLFAFWSSIEQWSRQRSSLDSSCRVRFQAEAPNEGCWPKECDPLNRTKVVVASFKAQEAAHCVGSLKLEGGNLESNMVEKRHLTFARISANSGMAELIARHRSTVTMTCSAIWITLGRGYHTQTQGFYQKSEKRDYALM